MDCSVQQWSLHTELLVSLCKSSLSLVEAQPGGRRMRTSHSQVPLLGPPVLGPPRLSQSNQVSFHESWVGVFFGLWESLGTFTVCSAMFREHHAHEFTSANCSSVGTTTSVSQRRRLRMEATCTSSHGQ